MGPTGPRSGHLIVSNMNIKVIVTWSFWVGQNGCDIAVPFKQIPPRFKGREQQLTARQPASQPAQASSSHASPHCRR